MIAFFIVIFTLGLMVLALTGLRIDYELGKAGGQVGDLVIILLASAIISLLGLVGVVICAFP